MLKDTENIYMNKYNNEVCENTNSEMKWRKQFKTWK